jgi:hypothetical protein
LRRYQKAVKAGSLVHFVTAVYGMRELGQANFVRVP